MKISIIIPVHNAANTLRRCVESFLMQNYPELELILIENNSSDGSYSLCTELAQQYAPVICLRTTQVGVSAARNLGLQQACGDIIGFADADDTTSEHSLTEICRAFQAQPQCSIVLTGVEKILPDGKMQKKTASKNRIWSSRQLTRHALYDSGVSGYLWNKFWRKEALEGIRFRTELSHGEDLHFVLATLQAAPKAKAYAIGGAVYHYYQNADGATAQISRMFDRQGQLKLIVAAETILEDFSFDRYSYMLVRRLMFSMASSQYLRFRLEAQQKQYLVRHMRKNLLYYLVTFFVAPMETIKRLIRLLGANSGRKA